MAGYSGTPLWKKLGYKAGVSAYVEGCYLASPGEIGYAIRASVRDICFQAEKQTGILSKENRSWRSDLGLLAEEEFRGEE